VDKAIALAERRKNHEITTSRLHQDSQ
jgi:hypothetical protein